ncbi:altronate dehydratase family protein [Paenibacillus sp. TRM 82003]|nr:altronate dehydratase family protein [Paenibacillus sp. TRM 82003]
MNKTIQIQPDDNVVVALTDLPLGYRIQAEGRLIDLKNDVPQGHKIAIGPIRCGAPVLKYGYPIGHALQDIAEGEHVHTHNIKTNLSGIEDYRYDPRFRASACAKRESATFMGFKRACGKVGIRNELWIIPTVGCVNGIAEQMAERFRTRTNSPVADRVHVLKHAYGCSQLGDDHRNTRSILVDMAKHPNAGGVLVLGLGCENNTVPEFKQALGAYDEQRIEFLVAQEAGDEIEEGTALLESLAKRMEEDVRVPVPLSELKIGLKCGGSDGLSGITANPLLGRFSDFLVAQGGTTVLTEVPEMFGAEKILMERAANEDVFKAIVELINDFKTYFLDHRQPVYENPSPGNKAGGITTLEDKSLGCTQKAGISQVVDVLRYGETVRVPGLNLLCAPGNDLVAASALAAAGCQMVLFTTGRGTPFGSFVPTVKISTNSQLAAAKPHWIDFNAGTLVEGADPEEIVEEFLDYLLQVAEGATVRHEDRGFRDISIWKQGVTL